MKERKDQSVNDTWDLSALCKDDADFKKRITSLQKEAGSLPSLSGRMGKSSDDLYDVVKTLYKFEEKLETVAHYAMLSYEVDSTNPVVMQNAAIADATVNDVMEKTSWFSPELMAIKDADFNLWINEKRFKNYRVALEKERRMKKHTLSKKEEKIISIFSSNASGYQQAFQDINNIDLDFGEINGEKLTHSTFSKFVRSTDESIREKAYKQLYGEFERHEHVIARLYEGSVKNDIALSKARGFSSSLEAALFPDNVPEEVYRNLLSSVHDAFPTLHRYYTLRAKLLGKEKLKHYDVYVPMVKSTSSHHTYDEAVSLISEAVLPLGEDYRDTLVKGLTSERWVDRYENKGKRSGAFSSGGFVGNPYICTNFEEDVLDSVFTLIHEGGHSMHSYYSTGANPFPQYNYTIFEAEVASTFNEQLLTHYLLKNTKSKEEEAYIISKNLDDEVATFFRQAMFAEYELIIHEKAERNEPITVDVLRSVYGDLLHSYFGDNVEFEENSNLEGLRIPHFYNAFYVYKYSNGIAASIALSERVLNGGEKERKDYLEFLHSGGSRYPLDALRVAGVDMSKSDAIIATAKHFSSLLDRLEELTN